MSKISLNSLLNQMRESQFKFPAEIYENIKQNIKYKRIQKKKKLIISHVYYPLIKYAVAIILIVGTAFIYYYSTHIPITVIVKQGHFNIGKELNKWQQYNRHAKIKKGYYLQIGKECEIALKFGKSLQLTIKKGAILKIEKMRKIFWYERYRFYLYKGEQLIDVLDDDIKSVLLTPHAEIRNIGTKYQVLTDTKDTRINVLKGKVAVRRIIKNKGKVKDLQYYDHDYQKLLESILETEAIIVEDEIALVEGNKNTIVNRLLDDLSNKKVDYDSLFEIEKNILIKRLKYKEKKIWKKLAINIGLPIWSTPVLYENNFFLGTEDGKILSVSEKGRLNWKINASHSFLSKGLYYDQKFYAVDSKGVLFAVDTRSKSILWKTPVGEIIYSSPKVKNGKILIFNIDGEIKTIDPETGEVVWSMKLKSGILCDPVISNNNIYLGTEEGIVYCINYIDSRVIWETEIYSSIAVSSPILYKNVLYILNNRGDLYAIDPSNGSIL